MGEQGRMVSLTPGCAAAGLALPIVVPPVREALGYGRPVPVQPPSVRQVSRGRGAKASWGCC